MSAQVTFGPITEKNIGQFTKINQATLEVTYRDLFYSNVLNLWNKYSWFAYLNSDVAVGSLTAREEVRNDEKTIYIMTCSVLAPYRRLQIGTQLMNKLFEEVSKDSEIKAIYLNMWVVNEIGLKFYEKLGFRIVETMENYYSDIDPPKAYLMVKRLD